MSNFQALPIPKDVKDVMNNLNIAVTVSTAGLEADSQGRISEALERYSYVIQILIDLLFFLYKQRSKDAKVQCAMLERKRDKFISRVSSLWEQLTPEQKLSYGKNEEYKAPAEKRALIPYGFVDFNTSFLNLVSINRSLEPFMPYSRDPMLAVMEKIQRLAQSMKYGALISSNIFVPPDVWNGQKLDFVESKQTSLQNLGKPLLKLKSVQQSDPAVKNISLFKVSLAEFIQEIDSVRTYMVIGFLIQGKKIKTLSLLSDTTKEDMPRVGSWSRLAFFKSQKVRLC
jgi:hypothetical protein